MFYLLTILHYLQGYTDLNSTITKGSRVFSQTGPFLNIWYIKRRLQIFNFPQGQFSIHSVPRSLLHENLQESWCRDLVTLGRYWISYFNTKPSQNGVKVICWKVAQEMLNDHGVTAVVPVDRYLWLIDIEPFENVLNERINVVSFHLAKKIEKRLSLNSKLWKLAFHRVLKKW